MHTVDYDFLYCPKCLGEMYSVADPQVVIGQLVAELSGATAGTTGTDAAEG